MGVFGFLVCMVCLVWIWIPKGCCAIVVYQICVFHTQKQDPLFNNDFQAWLTDFKAMLMGKARVSLPTHIIEEMFGVQKAHQVLKCANRIRKPERSFGAVLKSQLLNKRHKWVTASCDVPVGSKTLRLAKECFEFPKHGKTGLDYGSIVSTNQTASFYSAGGPNYTQNCADPDLLQHARFTADGYNAVEGAWLGEVSDVKHHLIVGHGTPIKWFHCLGFSAGSCALVWPGELVQVPTKFGPERVFVYKKDITDPELLPMLDHNVFQGCTFQWRSWLWIKRNLPIAFHKNMGACILPVMDCEPGKLLDVIAKKAFFQFNRAEVVKFASLKHIQFEKDCSIP